MKTPSFLSRLLSRFRFTTPEVYSPTIPTRTYGTPEPPIWSKAERDALRRGARLPTYCPHCGHRLTGGNIMLRVCGACATKMTPGPAA